MAKPLGYPELRARIAALLRRAPAHRIGRLIRVGDLEIDTRARPRASAAEPIVADPARVQRCSSTWPPTPSGCSPRSELLHGGVGAPLVRRHPHARHPRLPPARQALARTGDRAWIINVWGVGYALRHSLGEVA